MSEEQAVGPTFTTQDAQYAFMAIALMSDEYLKSITTEQRPESADEFRALAYRCRALFGVKDTDDGKRITTKAGTPFSIVSATSSR